MPIILGYWSLRGLASVSRLLLRYVGADFEEVTYDIDEEYDKWFKEIKPTLAKEKGFAFPNLPYLIDGEVKLTQAHAILKYLARKFHLSATSDPEIAYEEMLLFQLDDFINRLVRTAYFKSYTSDAELQTELTLLRSDMKVHFELLEKYLNGNQWFRGNHISYIDFLAYEDIEQYREIVEKDCLEAFPKLKDFMERFEQLPQLKEYLASDQYRKSRIFSPIAKIGGNKR